jgi:hypothetical protein
MILTTMPGALDYLALFSIFALIVSLCVSTLAIGIVAIVKKGKKTSREYFFLWLKIFLILFGAILVFAIIAFVI